MNDLPEAPASVTVKVKSLKGFEYLFTMRDLSVDSLMKKIDIMEGKFFEKGWLPLAQGNGFTNKPKKEPIDQETCRHEHMTQKKASGHNKPENEGKIYEACLDCNKWMRWVE